MGCRSGAYGPILVDYVDAVEQQYLPATSAEGERARDNRDGRPTVTSSIDIRPSIH